MTSITPDPSLDLISLNNLNSKLDSGFLSIDSQLESGIAGNINKQLDSVFSPKAIEEARVGFNQELKNSRPAKTPFIDNPSPINRQLAILDGAGDTLSTARNIGVLSSTQNFSDWVGSTDTYDYYRFQVNGNVNFSLAMNGMTEDAYVHLLNSTEGIIATSRAGGTSAESITRSIGAGTYYVRVSSFPFNNTNYNLSLSAVPIDEAGNTLPTARNIGFLSSTQNFSDWVGSTDTNDYYRFQVDGNANFSLAMNGMTADADVQLLNSTGGLIASPGAIGASAESITTTLGRGTYYVRVYTYLGITNYNLSLSAVPIDEAGNTLPTARNIGVLSSTQNFSDWVGSNDTDDYYRFQVNGNAIFSLAMNGLREDADVQLLNSTGRVISSSSGGITTGESITRSIGAGTYYVRVYPSHTCNTNYNLSLTALSAGPIDAGNTLPTARDIGVLSSTQNFSDWVGSNDTDDYYRFQVTGNANFSLAMNGMTADTDVDLLNSTGRVIASSSGGIMTGESITRSIGAGTYYVRVSSFPFNNTNYNLSLSAVPIIDRAGNTLPTARDIGVLSITQNFSDWVGSTDTNDYYRFQVTRYASGVSLAMNGMSANADVEILNSTGEVVIASSAGGLNSESIFKYFLDAGTYYVRVYPDSGNTNYNLSLSAAPIIDRAGNTLPTALDIGVLSSTWAFSDWVGSTDTDDYYRFQVNGNANFSLAMNGMTADAYVQLLNSTGGVIASSTPGGLNWESISTNIGAGTYYVRVYPDSGNTNYNLSLAIPRSW